MSGYEKLLSRAISSTRAGAELESERVYYSARHPLRVYELSGADVEANEGRRFAGKVRDGEGVDAADAQARQPAGLRGRAIAVACNEKPGKSQVFRRKSVHRGNNGLLEREVMCEVLVSCYPVAPM